jgi:hypothetical protein
MGRFHISQDETAFFQLTYEDDAGNLRLMSYQHESPDQLVEDAMELAKRDEFRSATILVDPQRRSLDAPVGFARSDRPAPQKAGE